MPKRLVNTDCEEEAKKEKERNKPKEKNLCVKQECHQGEPYTECKSSEECGKHKYMDVRCKVAIVTGGACGIGFAIANELLCQEAYRVVIADINSKFGAQAQDQLEKVFGKHRVCYIHLDVNNPAEFDAVFRQAYDTFGGVDIVVNNASVITDKKWEHSINTNLKGVTRGTILGLEWLKKPKQSMNGGVIVNISSICGLDADPNAPFLTCAKHGIIGLTKSIGTPRTFNETGVRVVALCPGKTKTSEPEEGSKNIEDISPELRNSYFDSKVPSQNPIKVAKAAYYIIRYAPSGSIWAAEDSKLYKVNIPSRTDFSDLFGLV